MSGLRSGRRTRYIASVAWPSWKQAGQRSVERLREFTSRHPRSGRPDPDDERRRRWEQRQAGPEQVAQLPAKPVADHGGPNRARHDKSHPRTDDLSRTVRTRGPGQVQREGARRGATAGANRGEELRASPQASRVGQHRPSGREFAAALAPTSRDDRAPGTGAHSQPEAVGLRPAPVVRLERSLAHRRNSIMEGKGTLKPPAPAAHPRYGRC